MLCSFFDEYSNNKVTYGPNIWIDLKNILPPHMIVRLHNTLNGIAPRKIYLNASLHRFFNLLPVNSDNLVKKPIVIHEEGDVFFLHHSNLYYQGNVLEKDLRSILDDYYNVGCKDDCLSLRLFCNRDPDQCEYFKNIVIEFSEDTIKRNKNK